MMGRHHGNSGRFIFCSTTETGKNQTGEIFKWSFATVQDVLQASQLFFVGINWILQFFTGIKGVRLFREELHVEGWVLHLHGLIGSEVKFRRKILSSTFATELLLFSTKLNWTPSDSGWGLSLEARINTATQQCRAFSLLRLILLG